MSRSLFDTIEPLDAPAQASVLSPAPAPPAAASALRVTVLASGSSGNVTLIEAGATRLLIDCGISARRIAQALARHDLTLDGLSAVLITHAHSDHYGQLPSLLKRVSLPVYATRRTFMRIDRRLAGTTLAEGKVRRELVRPGDVFMLGEAQITALPTLHDAPESVAYAVLHGGRRMAVITDLGAPSLEIERALGTLDAVVLESNHDEPLLRRGAYPLRLKQRILARTGHLSNEDSMRLLVRAARPRLGRLVLAHLSRDNNRPALALAAAHAALDRRPDLAHVAVEVAERNRPGIPFWV